MRVDGKAIAGDLVRLLGEERGSLPPRLAVGVLMGAQDAAASSFVRIKERVAEKLKVVIVREELSSGATTAEALRALGRLSQRTEGIIVQLPLPSGIDADAVLRAIPPQKDLDAVNPGETHRLVRAPVAEAVAEIFMREGVAAGGKRAVVVGAGRLVGLPVADFLRDTGAHVSVITRKQGTLAALKDADIVVLGAGEPGLVTPPMLKGGVVLIDAGTSEDGGRLAGDADPACGEVAALFTPVPGGVGPIAVAMIFKNLFTLVRARPLR